MNSQFQLPPSSTELSTLFCCSSLPKTNNNYLSAFDLSLGSHTHPQLPYAESSPLRPNSTTVEGTYEQLVATPRGQTRPFELTASDAGPRSRRTDIRQNGQPNNTHTNSGFSVEGISTLPKAEDNLYTPSSIVQNQTLLPSDLSTVSFPAMTPSLLPNHLPEVQMSIPFHNNWQTSQSAGEDGLSDGDGPLTTLMAFTTDLTSVGSLHSTAATRIHSPGFAPNPTHSNKTPQNDLRENFEECRPGQSKALPRFNETRNYEVLFDCPSEVPSKVCNDDTSRQNNVPAESDITSCSPVTEPSAYRTQTFSTPQNYIWKNSPSTWHRIPPSDNRHQSTSSVYVSEMSLGKGLMDSSCDKQVAKRSRNVPAATSNQKQKGSTGSELTLGACLLDVKSVGERCLSTMLAAESSLSHLGVMFNAQSMTSNSSCMNRTAAKHTPLGKFETSSFGESSAYEPNPQHPKRYAHASSSSGAADESLQDEPRPPYRRQVFTPRNTFSVSLSMRPLGHLTPFSRRSNEESPLTRKTKSQNTGLLPDEDSPQCSMATTLCQRAERSFFNKPSPIVMALGKGLDCE